MSDPTHLCRIGVGSVSANLTGWCRMCRIGVGSVSAGVGCVGLVSDPTHLCRIGGNFPRRKKMELKGKVR